MRRLAFLSLLVMATTAFAEPSLPLAERLIVIDSGHGVINYQNAMINTGRKGKKHPEHELTLRISEAVTRELTEQGARVVQTRNSQMYWREAATVVDDNRERAIMANQIKADVLVSIHCDWDRKSRTRGVTTLYQKPNSEKLGRNIHQSMIKKLKVNDRRLVRDEFTILENADMPAVIVETGFISNPTEYARLGTAEYQSRIAKAIADGLINYFRDMP